MTEKTIDLPFLFFWKTESPFSQWHPSTFTLKSVVMPEVKETEFNCAEQYMMSEKALLFRDTDTYHRIMDTANPRVQKTYGKKVKGFEENVWNDWRSKIVLQASLAKFSQNPDLKAKLLETGDKILVEASPYDRIWGIGLLASDPRAQKKDTWEGLNLLGYALTETRELIRKRNKNTKDG